VGRFACVVKMVVPPMFTSRMTDDPAGAERSAAVTLVIVPGKGSTSRALLAAAVRTSSVSRMRTESGMSDDAICSPFVGRINNK